MGISVQSKTSNNYKMVLFLTTVCLLFSGLCALEPNLKAMMEDGSDPVLVVLLEEAENESSPAIEKRQECRDTMNSLVCNLLKQRGYCKFGIVADHRCPETCGNCGDPNCKDSFKYGCQQSWCHIDYIADNKCERTCGTCHSTCKNTFKYGCKEEWCEYESIAKTKCEKTCGTCNEGDEIPDGDEVCPDGQLDCPDGTCVDPASYEEVCFGNLPGQ